MRRPWPRLCRRWRSMQKRPLPRTARTTPMPDTYLLPDEAAAYLRVAVKTLTKWRGQGKGPPYRKLRGHLIRYVQAELDDWMAAQAVRPARLPGPLPKAPRASVLALPPRRKRGARMPH